MGRPLWFVRLVEIAAARRHVLARMTHLPLLGRAIDALLFRGDHVVYLPTATRLAVNQPVSPAEHVVLPAAVVEHFCERATHRWVMDSCICRRAAGCEDYPIDLGCLFLGPAVLQINPRLGRLVSAGEAIDHLRRCREAGLTHMIGRNRLDTVWLGAGPADKLLTICNCCPCCCLWRLLPDLSPAIGDRVTRAPTVEVHVTDRCVGCGRCTQGVCFVDAIRLRDGRAVIGEACRGCGRCVETCPQGAIELHCDPPVLHDAVVDRITSLVDVA